MAELHTDLSPLGVKRLASFQQERHTIPSCIINEAGHSSKGGAQTATFAEDTLSALQLG